MSLEQLRGIALVVMVAHAGTYEGPGEVYTLPLEGGAPTRQTWDATRPAWLSWTPKGEVLYATRRHSTLPNPQLVRLAPATSKTPISWKGRIYFASDRDGVMNLWSMNERGGDLKQHAKHRDYEVLSPSLSNGEAFAEGFRRLGLGKVMGARTWGGEVWLSSSNTLVDRGIATAAETGVYGPEGQWLIEGHSVDPDIVVDKLPHETHGGRDAQFDAAVRHLQDLTRTKPIPVPPPPPYPFKRWVWGMLCA